VIEKLRSDQKVIKGTGKLFIASGDYLNNHPKGIYSTANSEDIE